MKENEDLLVEHGQKGSMPKENIGREPLEVPLEESLRKIFDKVGVSNFVGNESIKKQFVDETILDEILKKVDPKENYRIGDFLFDFEVLREHNLDPKLQELKDNLFTNLQLKESFPGNEYVKACFFEPKDEEFIKLSTVNFYKTNIKDISGYDSNLHSIINFKNYTDSLFLTGIDLNLNNTDFLEAIKKAKDSWEKSNPNYKYSFEEELSFFSVLSNLKQYFCRFDTLMCIDLKTGLPICVHRKKINENPVIRQTSFVSSGHIDAGKSTLTVAVLLSSLLYNNSFRERHLKSTSLQNFDVESIHTKGEAIQTKTVSESGKSYLNTICCKKFGIDFTYIKAEEFFRNLKLDNVTTSFIKNSIDAPGHVGYAGATFKASSSPIKEEIHFLIVTVKEKNLEKILQAQTINYLNFLLAGRKDNINLFIVLNGIDTYSEEERISLLPACRHIVFSVLDNFNFDKTNVVMHEMSGLKMQNEIKDSTLETKDKKEVLSFLQTMFLKIIPKFYKRLPKEEKFLGRLDSLFSVDGIGDIAGVTGVHGVYNWNPKEKNTLLLFVPNQEKPITILVKQIEMEKRKIEYISSGNTVGLQVSAEGVGGLKQLIEKVGGTIKNSILCESSQQVVYGNYIISYGRFIPLFGEFKMDFANVERGTPIRLGCKPEIHLQGSKFSVKLIGLFTKSEFFHILQDAEEVAIRDDFVALSISKDEANSIVEDIKMGRDVKTLKAIPRNIDCVQVYKLDKSNNDGVPFIAGSNRIVIVESNIVIGGGITLSVVKSLNDKIGKLLEEKQGSVIQNG